MFLKLYVENKLKYEGDVASVAVPAVGGDVTILDDHTYFFAGVKSGAFKYSISKKKRESINVKDGFVEVSDNIATAVLNLNELG